MKGIAFLFYSLIGMHKLQGQINTWWARGGSCSHTNTFQMSMFGAMFYLLTEGGNGIVFLWTTLHYIHRHFEKRKKKKKKHFAKMTYSHVACEWACVCACVVTFDFTLKAISILLRDGFLVSFLVVLLGVLTAVVDPLDSILLNTLKKK